MGQRSFGKGSVQSLIPLAPERDDEYGDENRNGRRDNWEPITRDFDEDGEFDYAPRIKLTIERYLLPLRRSIHRELDEEGNILSAGGVSPDLEVEPRRRESWRLLEMRRVQDTRALREWVQERFDEDPETMGELAFCDFDNPELYPGFDDLYGSLDTSLSDEDVRFLLRIDVRRRFQDLRGSALPMGDFAEDLQLQAAIEDVLAKRDQSPDQIPEYEATFEDRDAGGERIAGAPAKPRSTELQRARELMAPTEEGGTLSPETLKELRDILNGLDEGGR